MPGSDTLEGPPNTAGAAHGREVRPAGRDQAARLQLSVDQISKSPAPAGLQELSCQPEPGNYPRLIYTFLVYVLIEV